MNKTILPRPLTGTVAAIPSKSMAHRLLICAALADRPTQVDCGGTSRDIEATRACLAAMKTGEILPVGKAARRCGFCCRWRLRWGWMRPSGWRDGSHNDPWLPWTPNWKITA